MDIVLAKEPQAFVQDELGIQTQERFEQFLEE
jgi:hypothetical protein